MNEKQAVDIKAEGDGRLICPNCGDRMYAAVNEHHSGIPAHVAEDEYGNYSIQDIELDIDPNDGSYHESDLDEIYCLTCRFTVGDTYVQEGEKHNERQT